MIHYNLRNNAQASGGFTDLFILGDKRRYDATTKTWGSDFNGTSGVGVDRTTTAATNTVYNLIQISDANARLFYIVGYPLAMTVTKLPFTGSADNPVIDVGIGNSLTAPGTLLIDQTAAATSTLEVQDQVFVPSASGVPYGSFIASQWLTANLQSVTSNVSALPVPAAGTEIRIYVCLLSYRDWVLNRDV